MLIFAFPNLILIFMRNSFTYKCAQLWNKLPKDVKLADNNNIFKSNNNIFKSIIYLSLYFKSNNIFFTFLIN